MSYQFVFILRRIDRITWHIVSDKGHVVHIISNCIYKNEAEEKARKWISSWNSVLMEIEDEKF